MTRACLPIRLAAVVATLLLATVSAEAHPIPFSYLDLRVEEGQVEASLVAHIIDLAHDLEIVPPERLLDPVVASQYAEAMIELVEHRLQVASGEQSLTLTWLPVETLRDRQSVRFRFLYGFDQRPGVLDVSVVLFPYDSRHQTFLNIYESGELRRQAILDAKRPRIEYFLGTWQGTRAVVQRFLPLGVHHILTGSDHLLFLVGLLLLGGSVRRLLIVVTAFTLAHSVTLSLSALDLLSLSTTIVEPAIALSIVWVGADNLLVGGGRDMRAWVAFVFGLIHGFGFAGILRAMELPSRGVAWSLVSFNVGVEIGQLMVVIVAALALAALRSRSELAGRRLAMAGSVVVIVVGGFWFVQRVFFPWGLS
jgi:hydrogenase/urease accessory protein HupE